MLSKHAKRVQDALSEKGFSLQVLELSSSTHTAEDAANTIGCTVGQIVKSLLFKTCTNHHPILILASGVNRVNEKKIKSLVHEEIEKADAHFAREITGFAIGGIPPVGHQNKINTILIDEDLFKFELLWAAAGTPNAVFKLSPEDLIILTGGTIVSIK